MGKTKIEWCDAVWNPVTGCSPISEGCTNCYARRMAQRLRGRYGYPADEPFRVTLHPDRLDEPRMNWPRPRRIFTCSMGDLFHEDVPDSFIGKIHSRMVHAFWHTFVVLTKRSRRMLEVSKRLSFYTETTVLPVPGWPPNVIGMVTAENQARADERIPDLLASPFARRGVSLEPMLGPVDLHYWLPDLTARAIGDALCEDVRQTIIDWVIVGGETGPGARPMELEWVRDVVQQCKAAGVLCFVKQLHINGRVSKDPAEWPEDLRVKESPR